ncbi:MAG: GHKL domain-containing protein [Lunatimonas sp.]|uniref:sensor histidine kinase n=1 Tax=Lunatimonas sp. TaxID=2060141 RepID=UPI00263AB611|nr:ATP-binding protein [Lunatimonas sp.]MCC5938797.1 GHKL domain-containing protein [Lunatimonas sp.]
MKPALKITLAYLSVGYCWIIFSDRILLWLTDTDTSPIWIDFQTIKGLIYVSITGVLLYFLIRHYLDQIEKKVKELELLNKQLECQAVQLKQSNQDLEQFAYTASHDLQEPLRMISAFMTQLDKKYHERLDEKAHQYIYFAIDGAKRMRKILIDLLEFSRIGRISDEPSMVDVQSIIEECLAELRPKITETKASIQVNVSCPAFSWDAKLLRMIIYQLVDNALKFTKNDTEPAIEINCRDLGKHWVLVVKDNGIGIEEEYFEKIFVIFQRLHNSARYEGSGIGLASVKKAVELQRGNVAVESSPGRGSTFTLTLPKETVSRTTS